MSFHVSDWEEAIDELLRPEMMLEGSRDFLRGWEALTGCARPPVAIHGPIQARATCASMALELALKSLVSLEGKAPIASHNFARLFRQLFAKTRTEIASLVRLDGKPKTAADVANALKRCEGTFEKWRYMHEHRDLDFYEAYIIEITKAAHEVVSQRLAELNKRSHSVRLRRGDPLTPKQAEELVTRAVDSVLLEEGDLPHDVNERTLTHRLAVHLEHELRRLDPRALGRGVDLSSIQVDCEYNCIGADAKRLHRLADHISSEAGRQFDWPSDTDGRTVYPDIVVHKRGEPGPNLIVIEVKRRSAREQAVDWDVMKLALYGSELGYRYAFLVTLDPDQASVRRVTREDMRIVKD